MEQDDHHEEDLVLEGTGRRQNMYAAAALGTLIVIIIALLAWNKEALADLTTTTAQKPAPVVRVQGIRQYESTEEDRESPKEGHDEPTGEDQGQRQGEPSKDDQASPLDHPIHPPPPTNFLRNEGDLNTVQFTQQKQAGMLYRIKGLLMSAPVLGLAFTALAGLALYQLYMVSAPMLGGVALFSSWLEAGTLVHTLSFGLLGLLVWGGFVLAHIVVNKIKRA